MYVPHPSTSDVYVLPVSTLWQQIQPHVNNSPMSVNRKYNQLSMINTYNKASIVICKFRNGWIFLQPFMAFVLTSKLQFICIRYNNSTTTTSMTSTTMTTTSMTTTSMATTSMTTTSMATVQRIVYSRLHRLASIHQWRAKL